MSQKDRMVYELKKKLQNYKNDDDEMYEDQQKAEAFEESKLN